MPVVTLDEIRALVPNGLASVDLLGVIEREEAAFARVIGPLTGSRTLTLYDVAADGAFHLRRPVASVTITDNGVAVAASAFRLVDDGTVIQPISGAWLGPVAITFTPTDELEVKRVVIDLVRLALTETGFESESVGDHSYSRGARSERYALMRSLLRPWRTVPYSLRLAGSLT